MTKRKIDFTKALSGRRVTYKKYMDKINMDGQVQEGLVFH